MSGPTKILQVAAVELSAAQAKLVEVTEWHDLTPAITAACAGVAGSDPDNIKPSLTVTTTTGTFNSETVQCNQFNWTTHASINDGHTETTNFALPSLQSIFTQYDPQLHGIQIAADLLTTGTLNSAQPIVFLAIKPANAFPTVAEGAGWGVVSATSALFEYAIGNTSISGMSTIDPTGILARGHTRFQLHMQSTIRRRDSWVPAGTTEFQAQSSARIVVPMVAATDALGLCLGSVTATSGAVSGLKIRFRIRLYEIANLFMSDLDLGCQL